LDRRVLIVTDAGVPEEYAKTVAKSCGTPVILTVKEGEESKSLETLSVLCKTMLENDFTRSDCVVAVGGGVVGDLACFAASAYMRGIDFYNVPTTVLSAVDSSVGGKSGVNFEGVKNILGAFYQPKGVLFDADVLKTLPPRQISAGLAEAIKMALTFDKTLFEIFENGDVNEAFYESIIFRAVQLKADVVEKDERESGLRKTLNFGHTFGHAVEAAGNLELLLHGECVALGMIPFCSKAVYERLYPVLKKFDLPTSLPFDMEKALPYLTHDKKWGKGGVDAVFVEKIGSFEIKTLTKEALLDTITDAKKRFK
jgi:3-dehydroquinate synthase